MINLFATFEPTSNFTSWPILAITIIILPLSLWNTNQTTVIILTNIQTLNNTETNINFNNSNGNITPLNTIFIFILTINTIGLLIYTFTPTSHLSITISLALPLWIASVTHPIVTQINNLNSHLVPIGTPLLITPFIVLVELISLIIRPITLSVRLAANIIAGHLILTLLSTLSQTLISVNINTITLIIQLALLTLETIVAIIQAYVFTILSSLYLSEAINYANYN